MSNENKFPLKISRPPSEPPEIDKSLLILRDKILKQRPAKAHTQGGWAAPAFRYGLVSTNAIHSKSRAVWLAQRVTRKNELRLDEQKASRAGGWLRPAAIQEIRYDCWVSRRYTTRDATQFRDAWAPQLTPNKEKIRLLDFTMLHDSRRYTIAELCSVASLVARET